MESYGTVWVCQDCMSHCANGECGSCSELYGPHDKEPLSAIEAPFSVTPGLSWDEHADDCLRRPGNNEGDLPDSYECDCGTDTYSRSPCEGCGSWLHGERHAMTLFKD